MIMCVLLCYPVSIRIYYQQGVLFLVSIFWISVQGQNLECVGTTGFGSLRKETNMVPDLIQLCFSYVCVLG